MDETNLMKIAESVIYAVKPNKNDRQSREECFQIAYLAGLKAMRTAEKTKSRISKRLLFLCMQKAVYRALKKPSDGDEYVSHPVDKHDDQATCDANEYINRHMTGLSEIYIRTILAHYAGQPIAEIAKAERISRKGIYARIAYAMRRIRASITAAEHQQAQGNCDVHE